GYLERVASGFYRYLSFSRGPLTITVIGSTALINSALTSEVTVDGVAKTLRNDVLVVWVHEGDRWRFAAYQPTPIPAASPGSMAAQA
ncbi:MAG TPA: nuclear transport factor 2 family protein, partial [Burkholderiaceae bacterium]